MSEDRMDQLKVNGEALLRLIGDLRAGTPGTEPALISRAIDFAEVAGWLASWNANFARRCIEIGAMESAAFTLVPKGWWLSLYHFPGTWGGEPPPAFNVDLLRAERQDGRINERKVFGIAETLALAATIACLKAQAE